MKIFNKLTSVLLAVMLVLTAVPSFASVSYTPLVAVRRADYAQ